MRAPSFPNSPIQFSKRIFSYLALLILLTGLSVSQTVTFVDNFSLSSPAAGPEGHLTQGRDGYLYGTGDLCCLNAGTLFKTDTSGVVSMLHAFSGPDGSYPNGPTVGTDGNFYGTTLFGGPSQSGVLYELTAAGT